MGWGTGTRIVLNDPELRFLWMDVLVRDRGALCGGPLWRRSLVCLNHITWLEPDETRFQGDEDAFVLTSIHLGGSSIKVAQPPSVVANMMQSVGVQIGAPPVEVFASPTASVEHLEDGGDDLAEVVIEFPDTGSG